jgi:hypothetical protein
VCLPVPPLCHSPSKLATLDIDFTAYPKGTFEELFRWKDKAASLSERMYFYVHYQDWSAEPATPTDMARMAGLLICWIRDLVESPPRRPGATAEELADDYVYFAYEWLRGLCSLTASLVPGPQGAFLYPLLSRPAQAAWDRLVSRLFTKLPLSVQILFTSLMHTVKDHGAELKDKIQAAAPALIRQMQEGELTLEIGGGRCVWHGLAIYEVRGEKKKKDLGGG